MKTIIILLSLINLSTFADSKAALSKIKNFATTLKAQLSKGMKESPVKAVEICNIKAPEIQKTNSDDKIQIGRVSTKNRNPINVPEVWMIDCIKQYHAGKIDKPYVEIKLADGKTGLLKPIKTMPLCLNCHGTKIDPELYSVIKKKYPNDKAIGYKLGEIRGFFWAKY